MKIRRIRRTHYTPISDITAEAIVEDRDYVAKVYGAAPAICFTFRDMENVASIKRLIDNKRIEIESIDIEITGSYNRSRKQRSAKQIAAGQRWTARMNGDGDKIYGYDDGEPCVQGRIYTDSDTSSTC